jgi:hypothetical protein
MTALSPYGSSWKFIRPPNGTVFEKTSIGMPSYYYLPLQCSENITGKSRFIVRRVIIR